MADLTGFYFTEKFETPQEKLNEAHNIFDNKFVLDFIPDPEKRVAIATLDGQTAVEININAEITATNQYKVDYNSSGFVYFHPDLEGQNVTVDKYYGVGYVKINSDRVQLTGELSGDLNSTIDYLNTKINNIVAQAGDDNTEIVDGRLGYDGTIYPVIGDHIRSINKVELLDTLPPTGHDRDIYILKENTTDVQMKYHDGGYVDFFPKSKAELIGTTDSSNVQTKLNGIESDINNLQDYSKLRTYSNLSQLSLVPGTETIESIVVAMQNDSILHLAVDNAFNLSQYPESLEGTLKVNKNTISYTSIEFTDKDSNRKWVGIYHDVNTPKFSGWNELMTNTNTSNPNLIINGDFQIWQEGELFENSTNKYTADMWYYDNLGKTSGFNGRIEKIINGLKLTQLTSTSMNHRIIHKQERIPSRIGATAILTIKYKTNKSFNVSSLGQNKSLVSDENVNIMTIIGNYGGSTDTLIISIDDNTDLNMYIELYEIKLELGGTSSIFIPRSYGEELASCQRYFEKSYNMDQLSGATTAVGMSMARAASSNDMTHNTFFKVSKRVTPTIVLYSRLGTKDKISQYPSTEDVGGTFTTNAAGENGFGVVYDETSSNLLTDGKTYRFHWIADARL